MAIRSRLVLPDNDLIGYGYLQPRFVPDEGRTYSALDLPCPSCGAPVGTHCGPKLCPARIELARQAIADGSLEPTGPAARKQAACPDCGKRMLRGRPLPCLLPAHRCSKVTSGHRCKIAVEPGSELCAHHRALWAGLSRSPEEAPKPRRGRPPGPGKLTDEDRAEIVQKYQAGATIAALAREYDISDTSIRLALDKAGARNPAA